MILLPENPRFSIEFAGVINDDLSGWKKNPNEYTWPRKRTGILSKSMSSWMVKYVFGEADLFFHDDQYFKNTKRMVLQVQTPRAYTRRGRMSVRGWFAKQTKLINSEDIELVINPCKVHITEDVLEKRFGGSLPSYKDLKKFYDECVGS